MNTVFVLLILFQIKHFIADYPLQGKYMLGKFKESPNYILPLLAHVSVHGIFTFCIISIYKPQAAFTLAVTDMVIHFIMDRIKASPNLLGRYKPLTKETYPTATVQQIKSNTLFWWSLGLDQGVHHLTHYLIIYLVVS